MKEKAYPESNLKEEIKSLDSKDFFKLLFENAPDPYYISDLDGNFLDGNKAAGKITGYKKEEIVGKNFFQMGILPAIEIPKAQKALAKNTRGFSSGPDEFTIKTKNNKKIYVEIFTQPINIDGKLLVLAIARNITKRKKAETALRATEKKYRAIFENTGNATVLIKADNTVSLANRRFENLSGYSKIEIENKMKWTDFVAPEDVNNIKTFHKLRRKKGQSVPTQCEFLFNDRRGDIKKILLTLDTIPYTKQSIASLLDITYRTEIEEQLTSNYELLRIAGENAKFGGWSTDLNTQKVTWSDAVADIHEMPHGYSPSVKEGLNFYAPEWREKILKVFTACVEEGTRFDEEMEIITRTGKRTWVRTIGFPVKGKNKSMLVQGAFQDITQLKQFQERLQNALDSIILIIAKISEVRDPYTAGHQYKVSQLSMSIARELGFSQDLMQSIKIASLIHDFGKIGIPAEILTKPGKLSKMEFSLVQNHPLIAYDVIKDLYFPYPIADVVLQHHERINGSGYPNQLKGEAILLEAKIIGVADVVEAMSSHRPYRAALGVKHALDFISQKSGILFDPEVVDTCIKLFKEKKFEFEIKESPAL